MGHKDYLFQKRLAVRLPLDSFRFDFRGNHETGGVWKQGALDEDLVDLQAVVDYLKQTYGYVIELVVGHSRGSVVAFRWISTTEDGRKVSAFVNASGRYRMAVRVQVALKSQTCNLLIDHSRKFLSPDGTIWKEHSATPESTSTIFRAIPATRATSAPAVSFNAPAAAAPWTWVSIYAVVPRLESGISTPSFHPSSSRLWIISWPIWVC